MKKDIEFLYEIGTLRFMQRTWRQFLNPDFSNISEHIFRVTWIALILARMEGVKSEEKIMKMAMVHDIGESRTGDVNYVARLYTKRDEITAVSDMVKGSLLDDFLDLFKEYED